MPIPASGRVRYTRFAGNSNSVLISHFRVSYSSDVPLTNREYYVRTRIMNGIISSFDFALSTDNRILTGF
ncbi:hypothetical protein C8Q75DRAFT_353837 [Abortiporus biennis]|nr:hypothetical protein C8Q75DRAFT_353837 [Abortiporus biennis]